tara:strand:+ start:1548 stop:1709 length:162 start_codon:yes stop_codon:yes gene_type:complete
MPSGGLGGGMGHCQTTTRDYKYHENLFKKLDAYLATTPGTKEAENEVKKIRRP